MTGRLLHELTDSDGDRLRIVAPVPGGITVGVARRGDPDSIYEWHAPTPTDLAPLQDALADAACPDAQRDRDVLRLVLAELAAMTEALQRVADDRDAHGGHDDLVHRAPAVVEAARLIDRVYEEVTGS